MSVAKYNYVMDYIDDKTLFLAVMFARKMIREGTPAQKAIRVASRYYKKDMSDIARFVGQCGARVSNERRSK